MGRTLKSDNGPPFQSEAFMKFAKSCGFIHRCVTPLWPEANGEVERFVRTIKKAINAAKIEKKNWEYHMWEFLRNYRATPHASTKVDPATAMLGRKIRTQIPHLEVEETTQSEINQKIKEKDQKAKESMKFYADQRRNTKPSTISVGDSVIVRRDGFKRQFDPEPYIVTAKHGSQVTAEREGVTIKRNSSFFKVVAPEPQKTKCDRPCPIDQADIDMDILVENQEPPGQINIEAYEPQPDQREIVVRPPPAQERRSARAKQVPNYLKDYVTK